MAQKKKIVIASVVSLLALVLLIVVVKVGFMKSSNVANPAAPEADKAVDAFTSYEYIEQHKNGSYMTVGIYQNDDVYYLTQSYKDVGGQYAYDSFALTDEQTKSFQKVLENFKVVTDKKESKDEYTRGVVTFKTKSGSSNYDVVPLDISGLGAVDPWNDGMELCSGIDAEVNRLFANSISQLKTSLQLDSQAQIGAYLTNICKQIRSYLEADIEVNKVEGNGQIYSVSVNLDNMDKNGYFTVTADVYSGERDFIIYKDGHIIVDAKLKDKFNEYQNFGKNTVEIEADDIITYEKEKAKADANKDDKSEDESVSESAIAEPSVTDVTETPSTSTVDVEDKETEKETEKEE